MEKQYIILLVEDSEAHKELIYRVFEDAVLPVILKWADSITNAKSLIKEQMPDLVLADWRLNDGEGIELLEYSNMRFPLLIMTSYGNEEFAVNSMKAGVMDYIVKSKEAFLKLPTVIMRALREWDNIKARHQAEEAMRASEERYRLATDGANDIIWDWDIPHDWFYMSKLWPQVEEIPAKGIRLVFEEFILLIHPLDRAQAINEIEQYKNGEKEYYSGEYRFLLGDGTIKWGHIRGKALKNDDMRVIRIAGSLTDITERKLYERRIEELAFRDPLTGLPNRACLYEKLAELSKCKKIGIKACIFHIDIDNFKIINDLYGHSFGDGFICMIGKALLEASEIQWFLSRSGGDEFTIIIFNIDDEEQITEYANKIKNSINKNIYVLEQNLEITCSIGIYVYTDNYVSGEEMFRNADLAMYKAKKEGKNQFAYFHTGMNEEIIRRIEFEKRLKNAINNNEFVLFYQPQFDLITNKYYGLEALIRWNSPEYGLVPPLEFISVAEETGLIVPIGLWVLKNAALFAKKLDDNGINGIKISINVSAVQLLQVDFVDSFIDCMELLQTDHGEIGIEITESSMIENFETNIEKLVELKNLGFLISLDDFGTGYSSLNYLNKLPIDVVKLDKTFIDSLTLEDKTFQLTSFIISLAHSMGLKVVAEGVETFEQQQILENNKCDIVQGYLISKPLGELDALNYLIELMGREMHDEA